MKDNIDHPVEIDLNELESMTNFNQSFNDHPTNQRFLLQMKRSALATLKNLSLTAMICLIVLPVVFILIGIIYRNSCRAKSDLPLFLIVFGLLILINLIIYSVVEETFLALIRRTRSFSTEKGIGMLISTLLGILFGFVIFIWWIVGTIWWIKLTLSINPELRHPTSMAFCHPVVYWTVLVANILGLIGFIVQICIVIGSGTTASEHSSKHQRG